jgi:hypothetical protein
MKQARGQHGQPVPALNPLPDSVCSREREEGRLQKQALSFTLAQGHSRPWPALVNSSIESRSRARATKQPMQRKSYRHFSGDRPPLSFLCLLGVTRILRRAMESTADTVELAYSSCLRSCMVVVGATD